MFQALEQGRLEVLGGEIVPTCQDEFDSFRVEVRGPEKNCSSGN